MSEPASPIRKVAAKRGWFRRWLRRLGWLALALVVLHRPLFHYGLPLVAKVFAARQNLSLDFDLSGSIFTNLRIQNVRALPNGRGPSPVEHIRIGEMRFDYSLPKLFREGTGEFVSSYELRHADLAFVALPSTTTHERRQKQSLAKTLRTVLAQPAAYADRVHIEDFNLLVQSPTNETAINGLDLLLEPDRPGHLRVARIAVPGVPEWKAVAATTSYTNRNLLIRQLTLAPQIVFDEINFDASRRRENRGRIVVNAHVFGGRLGLELTGEELPAPGEHLEKSYATHLHGGASGIDVPAALRYFGAPALPIGTLAQLDFDLTGEPEMPRTWDGTFALRLAEVSAGAVRFQPVELSIRSKGGRAAVRASGTIGSNQATLAAKAALPATIDDFIDSDVDATVAIAASKLDEVGAQFTPPPTLKGELTVNSHITLHDRRVQAEVQAAIDHAVFDAHSVGQARITLHAGKLLAAGPPLGGLVADIDAKLQAIRSGTFAVDSAHLGATAQDGKLAVQTLEILRGENSVTAQGRSSLPDDLADVANAPAETQITIHVPALAEFGIGTDGRTLGGSLEGRAVLRIENRVPDGWLALDGADFTYAGATAQRLAAKINIADKTAVIEKVLLTLNDRDQVVIEGKAGITAPFAYEGSVQLDVRDLAVFQQVLDGFGIDKKLAGAIGLIWAGGGETAKHHGDVKLDANGIRYGDVDLRELRLAGAYGPDFAESREFHVASGVTNLDGAIEFKEGKLRLHHLDLQQAGQHALTGFVILPFDPATPDAIIPLDRRIAMNVNANNLDVAKLLASFGQKSPVSGTFSWNLVASGTVLEPTFFLKASARTIKAAAAPQYDPADLDMTLHAAGKMLELDATVKQPLIQPLAIKGRVPLDLDALRKTRQLDMTAPVDVSVKLPASSLAFLPKIAPAVRRIDGTAALDVKMSGTLAKPVFSGSAAIRLKEARMDAPNIPAIGNLTADLVFAEDTLNLRTLKGEVGGGTFNLGGKIRLGEGIITGKLDGVAFDLALKADKVLAMRDDSITLRADADLKLVGPLNSASATGTMWVTQSRFFKEIDILPIGLPGRPKPAPKTAPGEFSVSFPDPPLRDWKFDIAIKTREDDPFLIRGNLANGGVALALQFGGTGLAPWLDGQVRIDQFTASLPFSRLSVTRGFVYFKKDEPFRPSVEMQAESKIRDYTINALIHGTATDPQVEFTSEPPLSHADIVSLLATGTTTSELAGSGNVLASRAAMLAVQSLYKKVFARRGAKAPPRAEKTGDNFADRFQLELGAVDNRTGAQEMSARFKFDEHTYFIGDLDTQGRYTGSLKYLIRFR